MNYFSRIRVTNELPRFVTRMDKACMDIVVVFSFLYDFLCGFSNGIQALLLIYVGKEQYYNAYQK